MTIPDDISLWLQNALRDLVRDDWTLVRMVFWRKELIDNPNSQKSISAWQQSVDFIFRCLTTGLIKVISYDRYPNQGTLLSDMRACNPYVYTIENRPGDYAWNGVFVYGTDELATIVKRFFQNDDEYATTVNSGFVTAIEKVFADGGVPWSEKPLMPTASNPSRL